MMWLTIEIIAIIVECFLAINFNVGYFRMKNNNYISLKILGGTIILSLWDYLGTLLVNVSSITVLFKKQVIFCHFETKMT